ncbi:MAG: hypothetical protein II004_04800 [Erysipelotrichaceae bacterium]|nr:hypothetical protein [Erysipelotrichaceae bacterium]MBQ1788231.1 hypothetical protein [Erysipelotrichaceae bacterium]MBQ5804217.1 hypothetical protein [Erysipelotrichaceae bacterium]
MKKIIIKFLIAVLIFGGFSYAVFHNEELHVHLHAYNPGDVYGECPYCGTGVMLIVEGIDSTCTTEGQFIARCSNCGEMTAGETPPLGHDYEDEIIKSPTCTAKGSMRRVCRRCGYSVTEDIAELGHNYKLAEDVEATCEEDGHKSYVCRRCNRSYTKEIAALGHDIDYEEKEATCTEDGYRKGTCKRCGMTVDEIYPALGHDLEYEILKQPTCEEEGERKLTCKRCLETWTEKILPAGHKYPKEWTLIKEATYTDEGLETKTCFYCGHVLEHILERKNPAPIIIGGTASTAAVAGGLWMFLKKRRAAKLAKKAIKELGKPSFEDRTIVISSEDEKLRELLKSKHFLAISSCDFEELEKTVEDNGPDLVIIDIPTKKKLKELDKKRQAVPKQTEGEEEKTNPLAETSFAYLCPQKFIDKYRDELETLKKDKNIVDYGLIDDDPNTNLVKLVLPVLKPKLKSDAALDNIGMIADALGIPYVSTIISTYESGKDIKSTIEEGELNVSSIATVISDLASILGMDTVASVAGLVDDVNSVKDALDEEAGAHEVKGAHSAVKDIVEVVADLADKD